MFFNAPLAGLEPATHGLKVQHSTNWATRVSLENDVNKIRRNCTFGRARTGGHWIKSPTLYLLSYEGSCSVLLTSLGYPLVAIGITLGRLGVQHAFATHQAVVFVARPCMKGVGFGLALNGVGLRDASGTWLRQRNVQLVQDIRTQDLVIELSRSLAVEREPSYFADHLVALGLVSIVLRSSRAELHDGIALPQFVFKLTKILHQSWTGLTGLVHKHHRVRVEIEEPISQ